MSQGKRVREQTVSSSSDFFSSRHLYICHLVRFVCFGKGLRNSGDGAILRIFRNSVFVGILWG